MRVARQDLRGGLAGVLGGLVSIGGAGRQLPQRPQPPLADGPLGVLRDHAQHPADAASIVGHGAVGEGVVRLLAEPPPLQEQEQPFVPGRLPVSDHRLGTGADVGPDLRPDLAGRPAQRPRVLGAERHPGVGVVVEEGELRPPAEPHGVAGVEHDPHDRLEALRPIGDRPDRRLRPVEGAGALAHLAAAGEQGVAVCDESGVLRVAHSVFCWPIGSRHSSGTPAPGRCRASTRKKIAERRPVILPMRGHSRRELQPGGGPALWLRSVNQR